MSKQTLTNFALLQTNVTNTETSLQAPFSASVMQVDFLCRWHFLIFDLHFLKTVTLGHLFNIIHVHRIKPCP